ncbi:HIV Tat-specific factor 1 homolog [Neocloeon triangulifer]|uniref:HIV Tat-specific factor 1 homolog n=1 Tax=Neocloeon triangulifer TaxID=2078957 RepID=UPI00286F04DD|nr:HIV Tat-specific factor 1 homolog [Neocloeon triangulifer]
MEGKDYDFDGETYCYTDKESGVRYRWNLAENKWDVVAETAESTEGSSKSAPAGPSLPKGGPEGDPAAQQNYRYEDGVAIFTDPNDGTEYEWDKVKNAWIPRVDEEFIARYQLNYGFTEESKRSLSEIRQAEAEAAAKKEKELLELKELKAQKRAALAKEEPKWFDQDQKNNTKVYVSGLPHDITEQEFVDFMQKCGIITKDIETGKLRIKLYSDKEGNLKGDGLCTYIKVESVDLACKLLDGSDLRGHKVQVEPAKFQLKGAFNPELKPKKRKKKEKERMKKMQDKLLAWRPDKLRGERERNERVVVLKNLFEPSIFDKEVALILEYQEDLREECKKCGDVRKVIIYDRNPDGVAQIFFKDAEEADQCVQLLNNRWFGQRKITAETWDGKTVYKVGETDAEVQQRLQNWDKFLESSEGERTSETKASEEKPVVQTQPNTQESKVTIESDAESDADTEGEEEEEA